MVAQCEAYYIANNEPRVRTYPALPDAAFDRTGDTRRMMLEAAAAAAHDATGRRGFRIVKVRRARISQCRNV